jgi:hypothetical protein
MGAAIADRIFADAVLNGDFRNGNLMIGRERLGPQPKQPGPIPDPERPKHFET